MSLSHARIRGFRWCVVPANGASRGHKDKCTDQGTRCCFSAFAVTAGLCRVLPSAVVSRRPRIVQARPAVGVLRVGMNNSACLTERDTSTDRARYQKRASKETYEIPRMTERDTSNSTIRESFRKTAEHEPQRNACERRQSKQEKGRKKRPFTVSKETYEDECERRHSNRKRAGKGKQLAKCTPSTRVCPGIHLSTPHLRDHVRQWKHQTHQNVWTDHSTFVVNAQREGRGGEMIRYLKQLNQNIILLI